MNTMNRQDIEKWLKKRRYTNYTIHPNLVVDIIGNVNLSSKKLEALPFQFGEVTGDFYCFSNKLTSLHNAPHTVGGTFSCYDNQLTSLQYCPTTVGGSFYCYINQLTSLQYFPTYIGRTFLAYSNPFEVTTSNEGSWIRAIKVNFFVHSNIQDLATDRMTATYEMRWIP